LARLRKERGKEN
jgi:hypothetical protein